MKTFAMKVIFMKVLSIRQPGNKMYCNNWTQDLPFGGK